MKSAEAFREALRVPPVAWPTALLVCASWAVWLIGAALVLRENALGLLLMTLGSYTAFTPMHDASHKGVSSHRWLNEGVGRLAALLLLGPFAAFRYVHLEHHKHTNDPERDPDFWSGRGPGWLLPLRWLTQDLHYYWLYVRAPRSRGERLDVVSTCAVYVALVSCAGWFGSPWLAGAWLVCARVASAALAFGFDYLPHRPHDVLGREDRFRATTVRLGVAWQVLLLNQNLHLVHHLHPAAPFYRYGSLWQAQEAALRAQGVVVVNARLFSAALSNAVTPR